MITNNSKIPPRNCERLPNPPTADGQIGRNGEAARGLPDPVQPHVLQALVSQAYLIIPKALGNYRSLLYCSGIEQEDALQELILIFIDRMKGNHPFDPAKSKLQTYLYTLTRSVLLNTIAKNKRRYGIVNIITSYQLKVIDKDEDNESLNDEFTESFNSNGSKKYNEQRLDVWDLICRH